MNGWSCLVERQGTARHLQARRVASVPRGDRPHGHAPCRDVAGRGVPVAGPLAVVDELLDAGTCADDALGLAVDVDGVDLVRVVALGERRQGHRIERGALVPAGEPGAAVEGDRWRDGQEQVLGAALDTAGDRRAAGVDGDRHVLVARQGLAHDHRELVHAFRSDAHGDGRVRCEQRPHRPEALGHERHPVVLDVAVGQPVLPRRATAGVVGRVDHDRVHAPCPPGGGEAGEHVKVVALVQLVTAS